MARGQVDANGCPKRHAGDVCVLYPDRTEERGDLVGMAVGRIRTGRLVALTCAGKVDGDAAEMLRVGRQLERPAGVVGRRVRDEQKRLALSLHVVVDRESGDVDVWHVRPLLARLDAVDSRAGTARTSRMAHADGSVP